MELAYRLLGPVEVDHGRGLVELGSRRSERCLLGLLLLDAASGATTVDRLANLLWDDEPPASAQRTIHTYVARLRRCLRPFGVSILTYTNAYGIDVAMGQVDTHAFTTAVEDGRALSDPEDRATALTGALGLWRGPLMSDVASDYLRARLGSGLEELRLLAVELRSEAELECGRESLVTTYLGELAELHPSRERLAELLMLAYYRSGRQADALEVFRRTRRYLRDELGVDPSAGLTEMHSRVLRNDPWLAIERRDQITAGAPKLCFLPRDIPDFTGRGEDLRRLDEVAQACRESAGAAVLTTIGGTAGVGKTALAVHWGHQAGQRFPDGRLYINLRGFGPGQPLRPIDALAHLLRALGMSGDKIPVEEAEAAGLLRSLLAGKRVLVLLDNASSAEQVRPLLPGGAGSMALITSRDRLAGLVAKDGARQVLMDVLPPQDAHALLEAILGPHRTQAEPAQIAALSEVCGHLPLALRIAAANLIDRPERTMAELVTELLEGDRLSALTVQGDESAAVWTAFHHSYSRLPATVARVFRMLGLIGGADFSAEAVAVLADVTPPHALEALRQLVSAHLVFEVGEERYGVHDLLRLFATERARAQESTRDRALAVSRWERWYLSSADLAARTVYPHMLRLPVPGPLPRPAQAVSTSDSQSALAWLNQERANLVAVVRSTLETGSYAAAYLLADTLRGYFYLTREMVGWLQVAQLGLAAAEASDDPQAQAAAQHHAGLTQASLGQYDLALAHYEHAMRLGREADWAAGVAAILGNRGVIQLWNGRLDDAEQMFQEAHDLYVKLDVLPGQAINLANLGIVHLTCGRLRNAEENYRQALLLHRTLGNRNSEALMLNNLGDVYRTEHRIDEALQCFTEALALHREMGGRSGEVLVLGNFAAAYRDIGRHDEALQRAEEALNLVRRTGDLHAEAYTLNRVASVHLELGRYQVAAELHAEALEITRQTRGRDPEIDAHIGMAVALAHLSRLGEAREHGERALSLIDAYGFRRYEGFALAALARVHMGLGDRSSALALARSALESHSRIGQPLGLQRAQELMDLLC